VKLKRINDHVKAPGAYLSFITRQCANLGKVSTSRKIAAKSKREQWMHSQFSNTFGLFKSLF
jgi:hypothetical protein